MMKKIVSGRTARVLLALLLLLLFAALIGIAALRYYLSKINYEPSDELPPGGLNPSGVTNIPLIGVDNDNASGWEELGNADGLMIASVNENSRRIVLTSLMRDIRVQVPDSYRTKLTLVYHDGGVPLLIDTIEKNFGIEIDGYVLVNYLSVIQVVDAVGGIETELSAEEIYYMDVKIQNLCQLTGAPYEENRISSQEGGVFCLNGIQTAAYLRLRYAGNADFERTERARHVLTALRDKAAEDGISGGKRLMDAALPCVTTNLSGSALTALTFRIPALLRYEIRSERIPVDGTWRFSEEGYGSFVDIDFEENARQLQSSIYE